MGSVFSIYSSSLSFFKSILLVFGLDEVKVVRKVKIVKKRMNNDEDMGISVKSVKSPTSDRTWPDNVFMSGGNPHLTSRFCNDELGPKLQHGIRACRIQGPPKPIHAPSPKSVGREGCIGKNQSPTSDR
ncbi:hypothetical protein MTR_4g073060 [Medicago truncatula]|uniref:Uncharacterized protein n=1 Tax=Medicago truncatula TaxID=3880 RepID=G7JMD0_MEDTR|nr:hypothetical protein MTR_4g073060 [Medicago truncatula]